ncbi:MAG: hypothetical protein KBS96_04610 [Lachnospiraceae bacterium]|nr:hypothetical protein [Candidatus Colinaster scatohippi]
MERIDELVETLKSVVGVKEEKRPNVIAIIITVILVLVAVAAAAYAVYRFVTPKYDGEDDFDFEDDDFDDFFEDEEDEPVVITPAKPEEE